MFYIVFDFMMAVIMFLFGMWFYKSEGKATKFLSGYNTMRMLCVRHMEKE